MSAIEQIKAMWENLDNSEKESVIRFIVNNKPPGRKLKDIMELPTTAAAFDLDIVDGQIGESAFLNIATSGKHEVKRDFKVSDTGNIAVEFSCNGKASGLGSTKSPYWVYWLSGQEYQDEVAVVITASRLEKIAMAFGMPVYGGDGNRSQMRLVPVRKLLEPESKFTQTSFLGLIQG